ncbi:hypothetical protein GE09DRAFT_1049899 [Coniochaeta sp. 2T2.1]|nr:hypothetical protein GE09DRAFT_1049899 [Coniochaeta sp. 2T2.1]
MSIDNDSFVYGSRSPSPSYSAVDYMSPPAAYDELSLRSVLPLSAVFNPPVQDAEMDDAVSLDLRVDEPSPRDGDVGGPTPPAHPGSRILGPVATVDDIQSKDEDDRTRAHINKLDAGGQDNLYHMEVCDICGRDCGTSHSTLSQPVAAYTTSNSSLNPSQRGRTVAIAPNDIHPNPVNPYYITTIHFPSTHQSAAAALVTPWYAHFRLHIPHPYDLVEPFNWRQYADDCWYDETTLLHVDRFEGGYIYRREIRWDLEIMDHHNNNGEYLPNREVDIVLCSQDAGWLASLTPAGVCDAVSLGSATR